MSSTQTVRIKAIGPSGDGIHVVEVIGYHVSGWKLTRCLPHGIEDVTSERESDHLTAVAAATQCRRNLTLAFAPRRQPLEPSL